MAIVTLRYWAAAKEAAGIAEETVTAGTLAEALAAARGHAGHDEEAGQDSRLRAIFARSSFLIDGMPAGTRAPESVVLGDAAVIEVLPPFAGG
jgi:molybdopterin converting factor small subunit